METSNGYISKIQLENFMCHQKFEIDLHEQMNVIVGRNGSGKSSILTALIVGLGGGARVTGRGNNFTELIRHGTNDAYITLTIVSYFNGPSMQRFGGKFTIQRRIGKKSNAWSIKNSEGQVVSNKAADVRNICYHFGFHPDNVLLMLNQESAKEFLVSATPKVKYQRMIHALRVDSFHKAMAEAETSLANQLDFEENLQKQERHLEAQKRQHEKWIDVARSVQASADNILKLEAALEWRKVEAKREELPTRNDELQRTQAIIESIGPQQQEIETQRDNVMAQLEEEQLNKQSFAPRRMAIASELEQLAVTRDAANKKLETAERAKVTAKGRLDDAVKDLQKLENESSNSNERNVRDLESKLSGLEAERNALEQQKLEISGTSNLDNRRTELLQESRDLKAEKDTLSQSLSSAESRLRSMEQTGNVDPLAGFGGNSANLKRLNAAIERGTWKQKPVGPLGSLVSIKDDKWSGLVETIMKPCAWSYWIQHPEDGRKLAELIRQHGLKDRISTFLWKKEIYQYNSLQSQSGLSTFFDLVQVQDPSIERILVDQLSIERDAFCFDEKVAYDLHRSNKARYVYFKQDSGWRRLRKINGTDDSFYINRAQDRVLLNKVAISQEDAKQSLVLEISDLKELHKFLETRLRNNSSTLSRINTQISELEQKRNALGMQISRKERDIQRTEDEVENLRKEMMKELDVDLDILTTNKKRMVSQRQIEFNNAVSLVDHSTKKSLVARTEWENKNAELLNLKTEESASNAKSRQLQTTIDGCQVALNSLISKRLASERRLKQIEESITKLQENIFTLNIIASQKGEETCLQEFADRDDSSIRDEIGRLSAQKDNAPQLREGLAKREEELAQLNEELERRKVHYNRFKRRLEEFEGMHSARKRNAKAAFQGSMKSIQSDYKKFISARNFTGDLLINKKEETLVATANPQSPAGAQGVERRSTTTLSGGEKSFTQICLLLSVWNNINTGLVAMDEYDVFMDEILRGASMESLITTITNKKAQGILITPQGFPRAVMEKFKGTNLFSIHNLENPRP